MLCTIDNHPLLSTSCAPHKTVQPFRGHYLNTPSSSRSSGSTCVVEGNECVTKRTNTAQIGVSHEEIGCWFASNPTGNEPWNDIHTKSWDHAFQAHTRYYTASEPSRTSYNCQRPPVSIQGLLLRIFKGTSEEAPLVSTKSANNCPRTLNSHSKTNQKLLNPPP